MSLVSFSMVSVCFSLVLTMSSSTLVCSCWKDLGEVGISDLFLVDLDFTFTGFIAGMAAEDGLGADNDGIEISEEGNGCEDSIAGTDGRIVADVIAGVDEGVRAEVESVLEAEVAGGSLRTAVRRGL